MKAIVSNTLSFLKTHIFGIIIVSISCSVAASFIYSWIQPPRPLGIELPASTAKNPPPDSPVTLEAPEVTFSDGRHAKINFATVTRITEEDASLVVAIAGDAAKARASLDAPTVGAIYTIFEKLTYDDARSRRAEIEAELLTRLRPKYKAVGITLESIALKAFNLSPESSAPRRER